MTRERGALSGPRWLFALRGLVHHLLPLALLILLGLLYVEYAGAVPDHHHGTLAVLKQGVLWYFIVQIGVEFALYDDKRRFVRENWLDVLLVVPFLTVFRTVTEAVELALAAADVSASSRLLQAVGSTRLGNLLWLGALGRDERLLARETSEEMRTTRRSRVTSRPFFRRLGAVRTWLLHRGRATLRMVPRAQGVLSVCKDLPRSLAHSKPVSVLSDALGRKLGAVADHLQNHSGTADVGNDPNKD